MDKNRVEQAFTAFLIAIIGVTFLGGWVLMLLLGVLHNDVSPAVPAIGFWTALKVSFLGGLFYRLIK